MTATDIAAWGALAVSIVSIIFTGLQWLNSARSADAAQASAETAKLAVETGQRPWLCLTHHVMAEPPIPIAPGKIRLGVSNLGNTPALEVEIRNWWVLIDQSDLPAILPDFPIQAEISKTTVGPKQELVCSDLIVPVTEAQFDDLLEARLFLFAGGKATYRSPVDDLEHSTEYAIRYFPKNTIAFQYTSNHNTAS